MADWFKFYNDGLDSAGMQYCLSEQPCSVSVWLLILSEASKNRSGILNWDSSDFRLLGFARKLNISPGIFNQSLNLLQQSGYIIMDKTTLSIPGWDKMQSDYARGVDRGYYKHTSKTLASDSLVSTVRREEKRVEEKRAEEPKAGEREPHFPECNGNPTLQEVLSKAEMIGLLPWKAEDWFNEMQGCGWLDFHHRPIKDWAAVLTRVKVKWEADGRPSSPPKARVASNGERPKSPMDLKTIIQAKESTAAAIRTKFCSDTAIDAVWSDNSKRQEFFAIKREIKQLTTQLSNMA